MFLYGEEPYLIQEHLPTTREGCETTRHQGKSLSLRELRTICTAVSFFSEEQVHIIAGILDNKALQENPTVCEDMCKQDDPSITLVFVHNGKPDKRKKLFKILERSCTSHDCAPLTGRDLTTWIGKKIAAANLRLQPAAQRLFESMLGNNLSIIAKEIEKLTVYAGGQTLCEEDVMALTAAAAQTNVFDLVDALGQKQTAKALKLFHGLVQDKYDVIPLLAMIARQVRLLMQCLSLKATYQQAWKQHISLHPFVLKKIEEQSRNFTLQELQQLYRELYQIDKTMKSSSVDPIGLLDRLTLALTF